MLNFVIITRYNNIQSIYLNLIVLDILRTTCQFHLFGSVQLTLFGSDRILWNILTSARAPFKFKLDTVLFLLDSYLKHFINKRCKSSAI